MDKYEKVLYAGWRDMDYNSHMANTAYLDRAADVRMMYFATTLHGRGHAAHAHRPVVMKDEIEYFREVSCCRKSAWARAGGPRPTPAAS